MLRDENGANVEDRDVQLAKLDAIVHTRISGRAR